MLTVAFLFEISFSVPPLSKFSGYLREKTRFQEMATLHKFKLLATQCAVAGSPGRSPTTSPAVHLRRRKTLRMLLNRSSATDRRRFHRRQTDSLDPPPSPPPQPNTSNADSKKNSNGKKSRRKLKELFVASPPFEERESDDKICEEVTEDLLPVTSSSSERFSDRRSGTLTPVTTSFRYRLLRRAWRPMLLTIPE
ncbi:hypothetical protein ERO13_A11G165400v2 [Gossypium hirsutum]|uniref:Uncharacterized protein n=3 Tax=Gossypium TaxID=3633 RepID=A0A1U8K205_GOSHI|nr:uncharacterized protein LOC107912753 [Gossypium hirsutum]KAG4175135.1 hypothetical protein ERO13_A11G165400v2 [Gossypium hirsutum]TYG94425.1 hypothetical protein ES288_A11G187600v1 [Gossypium darwinii]